MIAIHDLPRGSGKTTRVIELMEADENLYCIVPIHSFKNLYPKNIQHRIVSANMELDSKISGRGITKVVLDEGFLYRKDELAKLYYGLGYRHIDVISYGTV